jgi:benzoylsuccinyl-CoA thiolase BbsB subunit
MYDLKGLREVYIIGIGQSKFGRQPEISAEELGVQAVSAAVKDAGVDPRKFDVAYGGRIENASTTAQQILQHFGVEYIETINVENACSTGSTAVHCLWKDIAYGIHDFGIAIGVESLSTSPIAGGLVPSAAGSFNSQIGYIPLTGTGQAVHRLMKTRGLTIEDMSYPSWKNHKAALYNPYAHYRKELSIEDIAYGKMVCSPVTNLMCCPMSDGAAAVIMCTKEIAQQYTTQLIQLKGSLLASGQFCRSLLDEVNMDIGFPRAAHELYEMCGIGAEDIDLVELHDAFSHEELLCYEQLGFVPVGECKKAVQDKICEYGGKHPVNLSGGLLSLGHPLGASGARVVVDVTRQLRGQADPHIQLPNPKVGLVQMLGGLLYGRSGEAVHVGLITK